MSGSEPDLSIAVWTVAAATGVSRAGQGTIAPVGEVFAGRYELVDLLGTGGMGSVWRAWDRRDSTYVAAKVLGQTDAASMLRFLREQSHRVQHPHVVTPISWAGEDDRVLFTMPLVRGGSVATLLGDYGRLPPPWVHSLLDQLLDALTAVHGAGLVHRDVKPSNLLLEPTGTGRPYLRLSDFGIASADHLERLTLAGQVVGTPGYLAPELLAGAAPAPRQDLYAAGLVAATMLSGNPPGVPLPLEPPAGCPDALWQVTRSLGEPDPDGRPRDAAAARTLLHAAAPTWAARHDIEVFDQLPPLPDGWTEAGPVGRTPATTVAPPTSPSRPDRSAIWPVLVFGVAGLALLVAAVLLLTG